MFVTVHAQSLRSEHHACVCDECVVPFDFCGQIWEAIAAEPTYLEVIPSKTWLKRKIMKPMADKMQLLRTNAKLVTAKQRRAGEGAAKWQTHPKHTVRE